MYVKSSFQTIFLLGGGRGGRRGGAGRRASPSPPPLAPRPGGADPAARRRGHHRHLRHRRHGVRRRRPHRPPRAKGLLHLCSGGRACHILLPGIQAGKHFYIYIYISGSYSFHVRNTTRSPYLLKTFPSYFVFKLTFFVACFSLDRRRVESRRNGCCPCYRHPPPPSPAGGGKSVTPRWHILKKI